MDPEALRWRDVCNRPLDFVSQGQDIAEVARIPFRHAVRKDKAGGGVRRAAGLAAKLRGTIALAFEDGSDREIIGIDQFTVTQFLAVREQGGLLADVGMAAQGRVERLSDTLALGVPECRGLGQEMLGLLPQGWNGLAKLQELRFRLAHQLYKDLALPTTLAAKTSHDFFQFLVERLGLACENRGAAAVLLRDGCDALKNFLCAFYRVVASVTR